MVNFTVEFDFGGAQQRVKQCVRWSLLGIIDDLMIAATTQPDPSFVNSTLCIYRHTASIERRDEKTHLAAQIDSCFCIHPGNNTRRLAESGGCFSVETRTSNHLRVFFHHQAHFSDEHDTDTTNIRSPATVTQATYRDTG